MAGRACRKESDDERSHFFLRPCLEQRMAPSPAASWSAPPFLPRGLREVGDAELSRGCRRPLSLAADGGARRADVAAATRTELCRAQSNLYRPSISETCLLRAVALGHSAASVNL